MSDAVDMIGVRVGRVVVVEQRLPRVRDGVRWWCLCDCGERWDVAGYALRVFLAKERAAEREGWDRVAYSCPACRPVVQLRTLRKQARYSEKARARLEALEDAPRRP